ncbi:MAG: T9SS type A sorting domain-containing protein [Candidatus Lokiarchaeota archaeon]|nr:T9SS type A sorting domain-containing protein [Candidatus Lokiarchaeota archaeon]
MFMQTNFLKFSSPLYSILFILLLWNSVICQELDNINTTNMQSVIKNDFLVNDDGSCFFQHSPSAAMDSNGDFIIVWEDERDNKWDIYFQMFDIDGNFIQKNIKVNTNNAGDNVNPQVVMSSIGNFVVVWQYIYGTNYEIYFQIYDNSGNPMGPNQLLNNEFVYKKYSPSIAMDKSGNFIIAWIDNRNIRDEIYFQRFDSDGNPLGENQMADVSWSPNTYSASVAMFENRTFVIAWNAFDNIYFRTFDVLGEAYTSTSTVTDVSSKQINPSVATANNGNFVIAWEDSRNGNWEIYFQLFDSLGHKQKGNQRIRIDSETDNQFQPALKMNDNGEFVIVWEEREGDSLNNVYCQLFDAVGSSKNTIIKVNEFDIKTHEWYYPTYPSPTITIGKNGNFVVAWEDNRTGNEDIYFQIVTNSGSLRLNNRKANDDTDCADQTFPSIVTNSEGDFVIAWQDKRNKSLDLYFQRFSRSGELFGMNTMANDKYYVIYDYPYDLSMNNNGDFVFVWEDFREPDFDFSVYSQRFEASGKRLHSNQKVSDDLLNDNPKDPCCTIDKEGNYIIAWVDFRNGYDNPDIYYQRFNAFRHPIGNNQKVNDDTGNARQKSPSIAVDINGNFVIAWEEEERDIYFQRYTYSGQKLGSNVKLQKEIESSNRITPGIAMENDGDFILVWVDSRDGRYDPNIYLQHYNADGSAMGNNQKVTENILGSFQFYPSIAVVNNKGYIVVWQDSTIGSNTTSVLGQMYYSDGTQKGSNFQITEKIGLNHDTKFPTVTADQSQIIFSWQDNRRSRGWDIYSKIVSWDWNGITSVEKRKSIKANKFCLRQNYPNPFNPTTTIRFQLPTACEVKLTIFNSLGQIVKSLIHEYKNPGSYEAYWDGTDDVGNSLSSGIYLYRLEAGEFVQMKKMVYLQ